MLEPLVEIPQSQPATWSLTAAVLLDPHLQVFLEEGRPDRPAHLALP